jgi:hypothetical protein
MPTILRAEKAVANHAPSESSDPQKARNFSRLFNESGYNPAETFWFRLGCRQVTNIRCAGLTPDQSFSASTVPTAQGRVRPRREINDPLGDNERSTVLTIY